MAFNRPGGGSSFQQEQVAYSPFSETDPYTTRSSPYSSCSCPRSSQSPNSAPSFFPQSSSRYPTHSAFDTRINSSPSSQPFIDAQFDIFEWHIQYQSCVRYFLDYAQYSGPVQAVAAFINIQLPFQRTVHPILSSKPVAMGGPAAGTSRAAAAAAAAAAGVQVPLGAQAAQPLPYVTLIPYIRRLIATAFDFPAVLHGFFGDDWMAGIGPIHDAERRNYLFAAKSDNWLKVKTDYDMDPEQTVPFLRPLANVSEKEIVNAETSWSEWLAMQDWMLGPRAPVGVQDGTHGRMNVKREED